MFFVVRSNNSFNFPLGLIKYIVIVTTTTNFFRYSHSRVENHRSASLCLCYRESTITSHAWVWSQGVLFSTAGLLCIKKKEGEKDIMIRYRYVQTKPPRTDILKTSISFSCAFVWNNLHLTVRSCQSFSSFKRKPCTP